MATGSLQLPSGSDTEATWQYIEAGLDKIMADPEHGITRQEWIGIYTAIHDFCTRSISGPHTLLGEELYLRLIDYLKAYLQAIVDCSKKHTGEGLLSFYMRHWTGYSRAAHANSRLFRLLERHWVERVLDEGMERVHKIHTLHLMLWKTEVFFNIHENVVPCVLRIVDLERACGRSQRSQLKPFVDSLVSLDLGDEYGDVYKHYFEQPFLRATSQFYDKLSAQNFVIGEIPGYMDWTILRLAEEKDRLDSYLQ